MVDVGSQQSPQLIYFGTESRVKDPSKWVVPIEVLAGYFFVLIALLFVGLGQEMGRRFAAIDNRVLAYTADILGSLAGIVVFGVMSYLPGAGAASGSRSRWRSASCFVPRRRWLHALGGAGRARRWSSSGRLAPRRAAAWPTEVVWSPYYQVRFKPRYSVDRRQQHRASGDAAGRRCGGRATVCRTCSTATRGASRSTTS